MSLSIYATRNRIDVIDAMRGFALCGIIFANLVSFTGFYALNYSDIVALPWWDRGVLFLIDFFIEGKFYSVFAILLGVGFALQQQRFSLQSQNFTAFWLRRMAALFVIGVLHMYLIWHGDILTLYSVLGVALLLFNRFRNATLLLLSVLLLIMPIIIHAIKYMSSDHDFWAALQVAVVHLKSILGYQDASLLALRTSAHSADVFWGNIFSAIPRPLSYLSTGRPFQVLGQFLLGIYLARQYLGHNKPKAKAVWGFAGVGLITSFIYATIKALTGSPFTLDQLGLVQGVVYHIGCTALALGYIGLFYFLSAGGIRFSRLSQLGRIPLTVYLSQTTVCVLLFYGYGFALMGQVAFVSILFFGAAILVVQFVFAQYWLSRFAMGPMEFLWRQVGYKRAN